MIAEEKQDDLSMEDILSSIKDILNNETQDGETAASAAVPQLQIPGVPSEPVSESPSASALQSVAGSEPEEDVFDLSKDMIIENQELADLYLNAENFDVNLDELAAESESINLDNLELDDKNDEDILELSPEVVSPAEALTEPEIAAEPDFVIPEIEDLPSLEDLDFAPEEDIVIEPEAEEVVAPVVEQEEAKETVVEAEPVENQIIVEEEPEVELPSPEPVELLDDRADAPFLSAAEETEAEPIFSADDEHNGIAPLADASAVEDLMAERKVEAAAAPAEETSAEVDSSNIDEILTTASEVIEADTPAEESDAVDASADIISNFAKMFAGKTEEAAPQPSPAPVDVKAGIGEGNKTIEQVMQDVIRQIIGESVSTRFKAGFDMDALAREEIKAQTQAWLDKNLAAVVEAAVQKEIQRVMAKVGR